MKDSSDQKFTQQLKSTLDQSVRDIDEDVRYQLQIARGGVLDKNIKHSGRRWTLWASAAGIAAISLFMIVFVTNPLLQTQDMEMVAGVEINIFEDDANIEIYEEYDFYVWLSNQESNT